MRIYAEWAAAASAITAGMQQRLCHVIEFRRERPLFTPETEWPWPDGLYFAVVSPSGKTLREFGMAHQAESYCRALNQSIANG